MLLLGLFGFMNMIIITKWTVDYSGREDEAPGIVNTMINLFLNFGEQQKGSKEGELINHQPFWCKVMLLVALVTPPWMLFVKPYFM